MACQRKANHVRKTGTKIAAMSQGALRFIFCGFGTVAGVGSSGAPALRPDRDAEGEAKDGDYAYNPPPEFHGVTTPLHTVFWGQGRSPDEVRRWSSTLSGLGGRQVVSAALKGPLMRMPSFILSGTM